MKYGYFVLSGSIQEDYDDYYFRKGVGTVLNPYDFFYEEPSKATVYSVTQSVVLQIRNEEIFKLFNRYPQFKERWMKTIFPYCLKIYGSSDFYHMDFTQRQLRRFIETSHVIFIRKDQSVKLGNGGYVFYGKVEFEDKILDQGCFVPARAMIRSLEPESAIFKFESPQNLKSKIHKISHLYKADNQI